MKKLLIAFSVLGLVAGSTAPTFAAPAEGKAVGQQNDPGEKGHSADAPGQTGDTGKDNAPGQNK